MGALVAAALLVLVPGVGAQTNELAKARSSLATHLKSTNAEIGPVQDPGEYYVSAGLNDFLPQGSARAQLPLAVTIGINASAPAAKRVERASSGGAGTSWAVLAAFCVAGVLLGGAGGLVLRRR